MTHTQEDYGIQNKLAVYLLFVCFAVFMFMIFVVIIIKIMQIIQSLIENNTLEKL